MIICTFPRIVELNHSNCSRQLFGHTNETFEHVFNFRETRKYKGNEKKLSLFVLKESVPSDLRYKL